MGQEDMIGRCRYVQFMPVIWYHLMSPKSNHRRLPQKVQKRFQNLFRFQPCMGKSTAKQMVEQPDFVLRRASWLGAYTRMVLEGGTNCPACVWFAFRVWFPRILRVGKVSVKVSLKCPLGAGLMCKYAHPCNNQHLPAALQYSPWFYPENQQTPVLYIKEPYVQFYGYKGY